MKYTYYRYFIATQMKQNQKLTKTCITETYFQSPLYNTKWGIYNSSCNASSIYNFINLGKQMFTLKV